MAISHASVKIAADSGLLLQKIVPDIKKTAILAHEITTSSQEQKSGCVQVNNAIMELNTVTQRNAASAEEMSSASEELANQAEQLKRIISFYKTVKDKDTISTNILSGIKYQKSK